MMLEVIMYADAISQDGDDERVALAIGHVQDQERDVIDIRMADGSNIVAANLILDRDELTRALCFTAVEREREGFGAEVTSP